jgi:hypothetical protein
MIDNKYIARLVKSYSEAQIAEIAEEAATLNLEDLGIDARELDRDATIILDKIEKSGIDIDSMSDKELMRMNLNMMNNLLAEMRKSSFPALNDREIEIAAEVLSQELADEKIEAYRHNHNRDSRSFSFRDSFSRLRKSLYLTFALIIVKTGGQVKASEIGTYIQKNQPVVEMVAKKVATEDAMPKDSVIKYREDVKTEKTPLQLATEVIKKHASADLLKIHSRFREAGAFKDLSSKDTLNVSDRLSRIIFKSARILYREIPRGGKKSLEELLSQSDTTEGATKYLVFTAMAYNVLSHLKFEERGLNDSQVQRVRQQLRNGEYEIKFKDDENRTIKAFRRKMIIYVADSTYDIEITLTMHWVQVLGLEEVDKVLKQSEFYDILRNNLTRYRSTLAPVEGTPQYDIYVFIPVVVKMGTTNPIHEVAFRIRCDLDVEVDNYAVSQPNTGSLASQNIGIQKLRSKKTRLFRKKQKYDWM